MSEKEELLIRLASPADFPHIVSIDDDACALYERAGIRLDFGADHPYALSERARWLQSAQDGTVFLAGRPGAVPVGLLVMSRADGAPYLDQLSVRMSAMRQGLGRRLLQHAIDWAGAEPLWLTTYAHVPWNRPFYERRGFTVIAESACGSDIRADLAEQRRWLPHPHERIAMRRLPAAAGAPAQ